LRIKTTLYLSIILTVFVVQAIANPIPFTQYGLEVLTIALFVPYFGRANSIKILLTLASISNIESIPFLVYLFQSWPAICRSTLKFGSLMNLLPYPILVPILSSNLFMITFVFGFLYLATTLGLLQLIRIFERAGIYDRLGFSS
jgi:hypothetical protein